MAFAAIVLSTPAGVTALKDDRYPEDLTSLQAGKALNFEELPTPVLALLREVNPTFEGTSKKSCRAWFFSAREQDSLVACGLLAAAPKETDPKEMLAKPTSRMIDELRRFEPKLPKNWLKRGAFMIKLLEKLCTIDIKKDVQTALLAFHDPYDRSVVCGSLPVVDLPEILRRQPRGWFSPAMVQRKLYENINGFTSTDDFTVPSKICLVSYNISYFTQFNSVEFVDQQLEETRKGREGEDRKLSVKRARQEEKLYSR